MTLSRHQDSWVAESDLGTKFPSYLPTFEFAGKFIDADHERLIAKQNGDLIDLDIPGWLRPQDALKIYEMAYFSTGNVLELGCYHGLSTSIIAKALHNTGRGCSLTSLELTPEYAKEAWRNIQPRQAQFIVGDARVSCQTLIQQKRQFSFAFVDHSHSYDLVYAACCDLPYLLEPDGFALFHDFNDERNGKDADYGVWKAVRDGFTDGSFEFWGVYGCTGMWRKTKAKPLTRALPAWFRGLFQVRRSAPSDAQVHP